MDGKTLKIFCRFSFEKMRNGFSDCEKLWQVFVSVVCQSASSLIAKQKTHSTNSKDNEHSGSMTNGSDYKPSAAQIVFAAPLNVSHFNFNFPKLSSLIQSIKSQIKFRQFFKSLLMADERKKRVCEDEKSLFSLRAFLV